MTMDFGALAPEINSTRLYSGTGSASMWAAASAWSRLAAELNSAATGYEAVVDDLLSDIWIGVTAAAMAGSVEPYVAWLRAVAAQAEHSAGNARLAAAAYETALAAVVPPPQIAGNRSLLASLVSTNVLGQNTGAIAATEAEYGEMWSQDAIAMYQYAAAAAVATTLTPFGPPPETTTSTALTEQAAAVTQATATAAGTSQSTLAQTVAEVPGVLQALASPLATTDGPLESFMNWYSPFANVFYDTLGLPFFAAGIVSFATGSAKAVGLLDPVAAAAAAAPAAAAAGAVGLTSAGPVSAGMAQAGTIGRLSVPADWPGAVAPQITSDRPVFVSDMVEPVDAAPTGNVLGGMPVGATGRSSSGSGPRYGFRPTVMTRPPSAG
jgi:PPE-repeat protein